MAGRFPRYNARAKTILNMVSSCGELDNQSHVNQDPKKKQVCSEVSDRKYSSIITKVQRLKGGNEKDLVNDLYSREYSLTSSVFNKICETQISQSSSHLNSIDLEAIEKYLVTKDVDSMELCDSISLDLLTCKETFVLSPQYEPDGYNTDLAKDSQIHEASHIGEDFDSDDSVRDKNYYPSSSDLSSEEDKDIPSTSKRKRKLLMARNETPTRTIKPSACEDVNTKVPLKYTNTLHLSRSLQDVNIHSQMLIHKRSKSYDGSLTIQPLVNNQCTVKQKVHNERINMLDSLRSLQKINLQSQMLPHKRIKSWDGSLGAEPFLSNENDRCAIKANVPLPLINRRITLDTSRSLQDINIQTMSRKRTNSCNISFLSSNPGLLKKRKRYSTSLAERKQLIVNSKREEHRVKSGCNDKCRKKCSNVFDDKSREAVNSLFWELTWQERRNFIRNNVSVAQPKRKITTSPKRGDRKSFTLKDLNGISVPVCKIFFLTTLGYKQTNDKVLYNALKDSNVDNRGKHTKTVAFDRNLLTQHVESFHPTEPHYRREHAPLRRYIPSDVNITFMHKDFCKKHPNLTVSYELYRSHVKKMNISFTRLGNEECEACEGYDLHTKQTSHDVLKELVAECDICVNWARHHEKYTKARNLYDFHKIQEQSSSQIFYSADLEKVIMLPRLDTFKAVVFCNRLTVFNQTFAPLGKITLKSKPLTVLWHDGIAGRKQEDIMSAFYNFLLRYRDTRTINIWLDNCSSQNKNWLLYSFLTHMVNSDLISTENIILYYFEPGHTFMSCDQVHHQVELAMKRKCRLYDYADFVESVSTINHGKVDVNSMTPQSFLNLTNYVSERRINITKPRPYLKNMSQVCFQRKMYDLMYKNNFDDEYITLRFMSDKYLRNPSTIMNIITFRTEPKGVEKNKKETIVNKLSGLIPAHKMLFWRNLPTFD